MFDGGEQTVGRFHPQTQLVALMASDHRQLVLAGTVGVDPRQMLDELGQRAGQQPLVDQEKHEAQRQRTQDTDDEDDDGVVDEFLAISGRVQSDAQLAVILVVRRFADQRSRELPVAVENRIGQPACRQVDRWSDLQRQHAFVRMADGCHANRFVLEQPFHHLGAHLAVEAVDRLSGWVTGHAQNALGIGFDQLACLVGAKNDLRATEHQSYRKRR